MDGSIDCADGCSAWNPGVYATVPEALRALETIHRPECVFGSAQEVEELVGLTGLAPEQVTTFRPARLALHELIVRVTADIAVSEGEQEEVFGQNFRRIAGRIRDAYIAPHMEAIEHTYADLRQRSGALVRDILEQTIHVPPAPAVRASAFNLFRRARKRPVSVETAVEREQRLIAGFRTAGLSAGDPLQRAVYKSLYRVLGAIAGRHGRVGADRDLLVALVSRHVCNAFGSRLIGEQIAPLVDTAIEKEGYVRVVNRQAPILISLKGASAAGKSSLRPMLKRVLHEQGIKADGHATISPDVWRRMLLDYDSLGPAYKYAGHLTSRELMVIDGKLDRYIRHKAERHQAIPHLLVDRFRFDSFSSEQVARVLHNTYAKYVDTMYMYFIVTPPEDTVERGWQRALERGRYKAVEDFLGHSVEAYTGMPKILFKWLAYRRPDFRYFFLDNRVPKGTFPKTIAVGNQDEITLYDPVVFIDIERYQKIDINARSRAAVYPPEQLLAVDRNAGFLKECIRRIPLVTFVDPASGTAYLRARNGSFEVAEPALLARLAREGPLAQVIGEIAPGLAGVRC
jgi:hypothetical protein